MHITNINKLGKKTCMETDTTHSESLRPCRAEQGEQKAPKELSSRSKDCYKFQGQVTHLLRGSGHTGASAKVSNVFTGKVPNVTANIASHDNVPAKHTMGNQTLQPKVAVGQTVYSTRDHLLLV